MDPSLPAYISIIFAATTLLTLAFFFAAIRNSAHHRSRAVLIAAVLAVWLGFTGFFALKGFFLEGLDSFPPRIFLSFVPTLIVIIAIFISKKGRRFMDDLPLSTLTWLHVVRIPVELVLYWLFVWKLAPELMTFAGRNFDILAGITAPFIAYFGIKKGKIGNKGLLAWNIVMLGLLLFIVINATLSVPSPMQQFGLEQPNVAILYFPFVWLPALVVPIVMLSHLIAIRRLFQRIKGDKK